MSERAVSALEISNWPNMTVVCKVPDYLSFPATFRSTRPLSSFFGVFLVAHLPNDFPETKTVFRMIR